MGFVFALQLIMWAWMINVTSQFYLQELVW